MNNAGTIKNDVERIVKKELGLADRQFGREKTLRDMGADSLDEVELLMAFEEYAGFEVDDDDAELLKTPKDIETFLCGKVL